MKIVLLSLVSMLLVFFWANAYAQVQVKPRYQPAFEVGYQPDSNTDEGGLWYVMDKYEDSARNSVHVLRDPELNDHIAKMVCRLAGDYCPDIRVYIIRDPHFNATMAPNGMMSVYTGLLMRVSSDDELAAVLGHEIAHFLLAHQIKQWRRLRNSLGLAAFADMALGGRGLISLAMGLAGLSYSRGAESESDVYGMRLMHNAGYRGEAAAHLWEYLETERDADKSKSRGPSFFRTHPRSPKRASRLRKEYQRLEQQPAARTPAVSRRLHQLLKPHYFELMSAQVEMQELEQLDIILQRHREIGFGGGLIDYFEGELYRLRKGEGEWAKAIESYQKALDASPQLWQAHRELAYLHLKAQESRLALQHFKHYRNIVPLADDHAMTDYYIESLENK